MKAHCILPSRMWIPFLAVPAHQLLLMFLIMMNVNHLNASDIAVGKSNDDSTVLHGERNKGCSCDANQKQISSVIGRVDAVEKRILDQNDQTKRNIQQALAGPEKQLSDIQNAMNVIRGRLNQDEGASLLLTQKVSAANKNIEDVLKRVSTDEGVLKSLKTEVSQLLLGLIDQGKNLTVSQLAKEVSDLERKYVPLQKFQKLEAAYEALEKKFTASSYSHGEYIRMITNVKPDLEDPTCTYTPIWTRQFGYKLEVCFRSDADYWHANVKIAVGDYDNVLKWPFRGNLTFTLYDQSEQPENHVKVWETRLGVVCVSFWERSGIGKSCTFSVVSKEKMKTRQYIKNDTMYFGVKITEV